ncbi:MAG: PAS domain S-box protein [Bacteroidetes bacterium]|nr:PAS domain S-box protein [Bacteroidota bacterium]
MKEKKQILRLLFLEENVVSIRLVESILRDSLPEFELKMAKTEKEFFKYVIRFNPDVILSGYQLEKYSANEAFELLRSENHQVPFIIVTNKLSEELAGELVKKGIEDCISRANIAQLPISILKAVEKRKINSLKNDAVNQLKQEQGRLETIFKNAPEAIINIGFKGEILEINPTGLSMLQVDGEKKLVKRDIFDFIHPGDVKRFRKFHNSVGIGNKKSGKFRIVGSKKEEHWVETSAVPLMDEDDHVVSVLTIHRNITEQEKANEQMAYHAALVENVSDAIISIDPSRIIKSWNPAAEKIYGWKQKEVIGKSIQEVIQTDFIHLNIDDVQLSLKEKGHWEGRVKTVSKKGNHLVVHSSTTVLKDQQGMISGMVVVHRDITEKLKAEEQLSYSAKLFENIHDAVISLDNEFIVRSWNDGAERIFGWKAEEAIGKKNSDLYLGHYPEEQIRKFKNNIIEKKHWSGEISLVAKSGREIIARISSSALFDENKKVTGCVSLYHDITEQEKSLAALYESQLRLNAGQQIANMGYWDREFPSQEGTWSRQMFEIFELPVSSAAPPVEVFLNMIHPVDRESMNKTQEELLTSSDKLTHHYRLLMNDGRVKHILAYSQLVRDEKGVPCKLIGTTMDITEQKMAEEKARLNEKRFEELFNHSPDAIYVEDATGTILDVNKVACHFQGYSREELIGRNVLEFTPVEFTNQVIGGFEKLFLQDETIMESFVWDKSWNARPVEIKTTRIQFNGKPALLMHARDISKRRAAEKAKRESELRFDALSQHAPVGIYQVDNYGNFMQVNKKFLEIFELTPELAVTNEWKNKIHPDDLPRFMKLRTEMLGKPKELEVNYRLLINGKTKYVFGKSNPVYDDEGNVTGRIGTIFDVTENKKTIEQMMFTQTMFQNLFEHSPDPIFIEDLEGNILNANLKACNLHGLDYDELIGKNIIDLAPVARREEVKKNLDLLCDGSLQRIRTYAWNQKGLETPVELKANLINYFDKVAVLVHVFPLEK